MTNFAQHQFATRVFRARTILTLVVVAVLATVAAPPASAQTVTFNRADFVTGTRTGTLSIKDFALSSVQKITLTGSGT